MLHRVSKARRAKALDAQKLWQHVLNEIGIAAGDDVLHKHTVAPQDKRGGQAAAGHRRDHFGHLHERAAVTPQRLRHPFREQASLRQHAKTLLGGHLAAVDGQRAGRKPAGDVEPLLVGDEPPSPLDRVHLYAPTCLTVVRESTGASTSSRAFFTSSSLGDW